MFLDFAEDRAKRRQQITMSEWVLQTERFLEFNERNVLKDAGKKSHNEMLSHVESEYALFDKSRKETETLEAEKEFHDDVDEILKKLSVGDQKE